MSHCSLDPDLQDGGCLEPSRRGPRKPALWVRRTSQSWLPGGGCTSSVTLLSSPGRRSGRACCPEEAERPKLCPGHGSMCSRTPFGPTRPARWLPSRSPITPQGPSCTPMPQPPTAVCAGGVTAPSPALEPSLMASEPLPLGALVTLSRARRAAWRYQRQEPRPCSGPQSASGRPVPSGSRSSGRLDHTAVPQSGEFGV